MKSENYTVIAGWMRTELGLTGNELLIYACIYGFSQTDDQKYTGGLKYLEDLCGASKNTIRSCLARLVDKGLIERDEIVVGGVTFVHYGSSKVPGGGSKIDPVGQKLTGGGSKIDPNNKIINKSKDECKYIYNNNYNNIVSSYTSSEDLQNAIYDFIKMRQMIKKPMTDRALKTLLKRLDTLAVFEEGKIMVLEQSILNGWQNIFEVKKLIYKEDES